MQQVLSVPAERSRKMYSTVLQRLQDPGTQAAIAVAMGVSESTVSRYKTEQLEGFCSMLAHAGLKIVPAEMRCFSQEKISALLTLAKDRLASISNVEQLQWD